MLCYGENTYVVIIYNINKIITMKIKRFNESMENSNSPSIMKAKTKLEEIGFTQDQINLTMNFLSMSDEEIGKIKLTSIEGGPIKIKNWFDDKNALKSLDGA